MWSDFCSTTTQTGRSCKSCSPILTASRLRVTLPSSYSGRRGRSTLDAELREPAEDLLGLRARAVGDRPVGGHDAGPLAFPPAADNPQRRRPGAPAPAPKP